MSDRRPIGVFDSGVGGLTVLREIVRRSPAESTIYLGDNARAPYGVRSDEEVLAFSTECLDRLADHDVKAIVVACNTSTAVGIVALRRRYTIPILGVIRPGATAAALATRDGQVGVIATPATIRSHAYLRAITDEDPSVRVIEHATPTLVPFVEAGVLSGPSAEAAVAEALAPLFVGSDVPIDTLLLGCTHYPLLRPIIAALADMLDINGLRSRDQRAEEAGDSDESDGAVPPATPATHRQLTTGDPETFHALASRLFGSAFPDVDRIDLAVPAR